MNFITMASSSSSSSASFSIASLSAVLVTLFAFSAAYSVSQNGAGSEQQQQQQQQQQSQAQQIYNGIKGGGGCQSDRLVVYKVVLHTYWTRDLFPKHYPDWRPVAQWTKTVGRSHDASFNLFSLGKQASSGMRAFAETGRSDGLDQRSGSAESSVFDEFVLPAILSGSGRSEGKIFVDSNHTMVSLATRIVPSPDWFVGVDSFQLCVGGTWMDSVTVELDPLDAGTDNGFTFTAPNWPTDPQGVIYRITSRYPAHPAGSFFYPHNKRLPPIATFQFIKQKEYELSEVFRFAEDDRKYDTVQTRTHLDAEHNHVEMNNELSADIESERQHEMAAPSSHITEKDRIRARLLAKLNPIGTNLTTFSIDDTNASPPRATSVDPSTMYVLPKNNKTAIIDHIAHRYDIASSSSSTATSSTSDNVAKHRKKPRLHQRPPRKDCRVGHWSGWSECSKECGIGDMHRYRKVIRPAKRGGRPCPPLKESKWCGSARDCNTAAGYFKW